MPRPHGKCWVVAIAAYLAWLDSPPARGAEIELSLLAGAQQTGGLATRHGELDLSAGGLFAGSVGWRVRPDGVVEIAWSHQTANATGHDSGEPVHFDVDLDAVEFGGIWETRPGRFRPFIGMSLGATRLAGPGADFGEGWWFSGAFFGGLRYGLGEHALLRLEARGSGILIGDGGALACSSLPGQCSLALTGSLLGAVSARVGVAARF